MNRPKQYPDGFAVNRFLIFFRENTSGVGFRNSLVFIPRGGGLPLIMKVYNRHSFQGSSHEARPALHHRVK